MVLPKRTESSRGSEDPCHPSRTIDALQVGARDPRDAHEHGSRRFLRRRTGRVVTVTGAASFLGTNLIGLLEEDPTIARIVAIDIKPPQTAQTKTRFYEVDFTQPTAEARLSEIFAAERTDTLVHLAFLSSPSHAIALAHELESVGTRHLLVAARHAQVQKVVMWSQTCLYGAHPSNPNFLTERHALRASSNEPFFVDKLEAEAELARFTQKSPGAVVTVLRTAPILGPTVHNYVTRYLARRVVPTMMGFDPLVQFVHEVDAIAAFKLAVDRDHPGIFNIVGDGVLPLSTVVKLAGRLAMPVPHSIARTFGSALWLAQLVEAPPTFLRHLRFLCVADGAKAKETMGFRPAYTTREAVLDFTNAQRLRDVKLLQENVA
ncbi:UDP-glucose 4-epimerase [Labilithrix luteola]|uniref:UDP-glucose 4-epimerase n=1 Tax=Labilithrix luteola TaxID=1391654 RepID=A0A0K1Q922_9BACT|nr:UDP-glucose 4-epimerase [Labilithrix luteola]